MKKEIVLFFPGKNFPGSMNIGYPPLALVSIGNYLRDKGNFKVRIVDARVEDYKKTRLSNVSFVGISAMSGRPIADGLEIARFVREKDSSIPIVWGGVHVSLLPEQSLKNEFVDIVVRGEGEQTFLEIAQQKKLEKIKGISFKRKGEIIHNPDRQFIDLDKINDIDYSLLKHSDAYNPNGSFHFTSSRGCPHRCGFCYNKVFCAGRWRTKSIERIKKDIDFVLEKYNPKRLDFLEDNFFANRKRAEEIARHLIERGFKNEWSGDCRANYFRNYDDNFLSLLKKSGCCEMIIGAESGSDRVLKMIKKDITAQDIVKANGMCKRNGIKVLNLFMAGFPHETKKDILKTMDLIDRLDKINGKLCCIISIFSPYPGTELFEEAVKSGYKPPQSLGEWGQWLFSSNQTSWLDKKAASELEYIAIASRVRNALPNFLKLNKREALKQLVKLPFTVSSNLRWKARYFGLPADMLLWKAVQKSRGYF